MSDSLEERLRVLKICYDKGYITKSEYDYFRNKELENWSKEHEKQKSFWRRMWDKTCYYVERILSRLIESILDSINTLLEYLAKTIGFGLGDLSELARKGAWLRNSWPVASRTIVATGSVPTLIKHFNQVIKYANQLCPQEIWIVHFLGRILLHLNQQNNADTKSMEGVPKILVKEIDDFIPEEPIPMILPVNLSQPRQKYPKSLEEKEIDSFLESKNKKMLSSLMRERNREKKPRTQESPAISKEESSMFEASNVHNSPSIEKEKHNGTNIDHSANIT
ncbi:9342_t:CDS:2 [Acaulospora morrowiae]|uniref:9342_t:CDS:1 n=1 Tax=Acaulospora morrowiae TaxID=94023 RepID=A0A9N9AMR6_9GLOM|nr:9342_t:CDS:2 [Acaulospora morrowiae]